MTAFNLSSLTEALDGLQCNANLNGQLQRCTEKNCPVFNYNDIDTHLCTIHETYMRGAIFRRRFPGFETTALVSSDQSIPSVAGPAAEDIRIVRGNRTIIVFLGAHLDALTTGLHHGIKAGLLHYINDYILFLGDSPDKYDILLQSKSHFGARYRQQALKNASDGLAVMVGFTSNLVKRLDDLR
ncbi:hypothetical protein EC957_003300 [Mortierella hygrophila]|uniref:Uncharacterized protein n=1 Tax=Mortierella hygrophila TaxID=979708 RepID=A0A9P6K0Y8_9FUNG|nr:hypothetical protein EC957_003300 [Mortierella hygrophila]